MKITTKSSSGEYFFKAFTEQDYWIVEQIVPDIFGNTYEYVGKGYSRQAVLDLCLNYTPGNSKRVTEVY